MSGVPTLRSRAGRSKAAGLVAAAAGTFAVAASPALAGDATAGQRKAGLCVACHGEYGISVQPNVPHLAGQPEIYVIEQLRQYRSGKRLNEVMSVIAKPLSDADIDDLAAWFAKIQVEAKPPG